MKRFFNLALVLLLIATLSPAAARADNAQRPVRALFDQRVPPSAASGPFPSNRFTVADSAQITQLRVNLPKPDCAVRLSDCADLDVLNALDGFSLQPTVSIPFDGDLDLRTATSSAVFVVSLRDVTSSTSDNPQIGQRIGIDQVVWDPSTHTLRIQVDRLLDQHAKYLIVVTRTLLSSNGESVQPSIEFLRFAVSSDPASTGLEALDNYRKELRGALDALERSSVTAKGQVVAASIFTTLSATATLEKMRAAVNSPASPAPTAEFNIGPGSHPRAVFPRADVATIQPSPPPNDFLGDSRVGTIAFGKYDSPDFEVHPDQYIPATSTGNGMPTILRTNPVYFNLVLPAGTPPPGGWPVAIFGHGVTGNKNAIFAVAATLAGHGIATIGINAVGHGGDPRGSLNVTLSSGLSVALPGGGRGIDQNGDGKIETDEGFAARSPSIVFVTDGIRQTVADNFQLVRVIQAGADVDADGIRDLDPTHIYYVGNSLGGNFGVLLVALEPSIRAGVFSSAGSPVVENRRLSPPSQLAPNPLGGRSSLGAMLDARTPSLLNSPGITSLDGVAVSPRMAGARGPFFFNESFPLRHQMSLQVVLSGVTAPQTIKSPVTNPAPGAIAIQEVLDRLTWASQPANAVAFAPHLRTDPLAGTAPRPVLFQFARGDQGSPNPNTTAMLRAGALADSATLYRHDLAYAANHPTDPNFPPNPHGFLVSTGGSLRSVALDAQEQMAEFFQSDGSVVLPEDYFVVPPLPMDTLPDDLDYIH
jgi:dienelactone hydrolase